MSLNIDLIGILESFCTPLALQWIHKQNRKSCPISFNQYTNWINRFDPDTNNVIEVIDCNIAKQLTFALLKDKSFTTCILTEGISPPAALQKLAKQKDINILRTPRHSKRVITELGCHMANTLSEPEYKHGVFLRIYGLGVLIMGKSGCGKSNLALELVEKGHQLIADDAPLFYTFGKHQLYGICPPILSGFLEVADLGVLNIDKLFGAKASIPLNHLDLAMELVTDSTQIALDSLKSIHHYITIRGVEIPVIRIFVNPSRNMATVVDTAVKNHVLYRDGYDANAALTKKQQQAIKDSAQ